MLSAITLSIALVLGAPASDGLDKAESRPDQSEPSGSEPKRLSSDEIARLRTGDGVPDYCEIYWTTNPFTGEQQCDYVICRPWGQPWSIHECFEFRL